MVNKKLHPKFNVPNQGAKNRSKVKDSWRKQRGIDNKKRVKKNFAGAEPTIGYKNPDSIRGLRFNGKRNLVVHNMDELEKLIDSKEKVDITLAKNLGKRKRQEMIKKVKGTDYRVTNGVGI